MRIAKLDENAKLPTRKNPTDAGLDLYAFSPYGFMTIPPQGVGIVSTRVTVEIPKGHIGWITNKSSKNYLIGGGIVDEGYRGEILVKIINTGYHDIQIHHHDAVAQLLIIPVKILDVEDAVLSDILEEETDRMADGGIVRQITQKELVEDDEIWLWDDDLPAFCGICGEEMQIVRPGKYQCINCEENWNEEDDYDYFSDDLNFDAYREREIFD